MKNTILLAACAALLAASPAVAHGPHEHGAARLNVAVDGAVVSIDLESPHANALPFEHASTTPAQREAYYRTRAERAKYRADREAERSAEAARIAKHETSKGIKKTV